MMTEAFKPLESTKILSLALDNCLAQMNGADSALSRIYQHSSDEFGNVLEYDFDTFEEELWGMATLPRNKYAIFRDMAHILSISFIKNCRFSYQF